MKKKKIIKAMILIVLGVIGLIYAYNTSPKKELIIYETKNHTPYNPRTNNAKTDKIYKKIKTETYKPELLDISKNNKYALIKDNSLKIINLETDETTKIKLSPNYEIYTLETITNEDIIEGISFYKEKEFKDVNKSGYFNYTEEKILYEDKYSVINILGKNILLASKKESNGEKLYLLNDKEEKIIKEYTYKEDTIKIFSGKETILGLLNENETYNLYKINGDVFAENLDFISSDNNVIYGIKEKSVYEYSFEGEQIGFKPLKEEYLNIEFVSNRYLVYQNNNKLMLLDLNSHSPRELIEWKNTYSFANKIMGYSNNGLSTDTKNIEGIYIYVLDNDTKKLTEICYDIKNKKVLINEIENN